MKVIAVASFLAFSALRLLAQQPVRSSDGGLTLQTTASTVLVDVVVTDARHHPVSGLTQENFILSEDKQRQSIVSFVEHHAAAAPSTLPKLPPGIFSNLALPPADAAVNVILIDTLNTSLPDQAYVRQQILKLVNSPAPPPNTAIFSLGTRLRMLQSFSSDPEVLRAVVTRQFGKASPLLDDPVSQSDSAAVLSELASVSASNPAAAQVAAAVQSFFAENNAMTAKIRQRDTLDELNQLARYLAAIPGRKNLIWFAGSFPVDVLPRLDAANSLDPFGSVGNAEAEYRETVTLLAHSQVAVYPIDAHGLQTSPLFTASAANPQYARGPAAMAADDDAFTQQLASEHLAGTRMAEDTGGEAYLNTNDLAGAVHDAIDQGSSFYTLAYTPHTSKRQGSFHAIEIKLAGAHDTLSYRRGYYDDAPLNDPHKRPSMPAASDAALQKELLYGAPAATQILYEVLVQPSSVTLETTLAPRNISGHKGYATLRPPFRRYRISYAVSPANLAFTQPSPGFHEVHLTFVAITYQADGQPVTSRTDTLVARLNDADYAGLNHGGLRLDQEISIPDQGEFTLRTAVLDPASDRIGSAETSVRAFKNLPVSKPHTNSQPGQR